MSWKVKQSRKNKRRSAQTTSESASLISAEKTQIAQIIAALFQHAPHRGVGAVNAGRAAERTPPRQPTEGAPRAEYRCTGCDTLNWCDRSVCRSCKQPRPVSRPAGGGPARRVGPGARPGTAAVAISPGQQAEELKQAAQKAVRAGATAESVQPLVEQERECRARQAAAKSSKPLDTARAAVEQAAAAVSAADAAIATAEAAVVVARQKAADARNRHRDKIADFERVEAARAENTGAGCSSMAAQNLLTKAQCVTASLESLMTANANSNLSIPDAFRKEVEDLKLAMETAQQVQQTLQTTSATAAGRIPTPATTNANVKFMLHNTKKLMELLESATQSGGLPERVMDCMTTVNQSILAIEPVRAPKLGEEIGSSDPDAEFLPEEDESMGSEDGLHATAVAIMEQIQGAQDEEALATVMLHLRSTMKGGGKGKTRFASPYRA